MNGVLILSHGSRAFAAQETLERIVSMVKEKMPDQLIETACMEFSDKNIEWGLSLLAGKGATNIKVVPYFLFEGIHIREDIPEEIAHFKEKNPCVEVTLGKTLGTDERLADILVERIRH